MRARPLCHRLEYAFRLRLIIEQDVKVLSPQTWEIGFRKTDNLRTLGRRIMQKLSDLV
jgi:hypothetical protein